MYDGFTTIRTRVTLAFSLAALLLSSGHGYYQLQRERHDLHASIKREVLMLGRSMQAAVENALRDRQLTDVQDPLERLERVEPSVDIVVFDRQKVVAQSAGSRSSDETLRSIVDDVLQHGDSLLRFETGSPGRAVLGLPLSTTPSGIVGCLVLVRPLDDALRDLAATLRRIGEGAALLALLMTVLGFVLSTLYVGRPLRRVIEAMRQVRTGELGAKLPAGRRDEIGSLANEFNYMVADLAEARRRLVEEREARIRMERGLQRVDKLVTIGQIAVQAMRARSFACWASTPSRSCCPITIRASAAGGAPDRLHAMVRRGAWGLAIALSAFLLGGAADLRAAPAPEPVGPAVRYEAAGEEVVAVAADGARRATPLGCPARRLLEHEGRVHVACGSSGVIVLEPTAGAGLRVAERVSFEGEVTDLFVHDGRLWAQVVRLEARPLPGGTRSAEPVAPTTAPVPFDLAPGYQPTPSPPSAEKPSAAAPARRSSAIRRGRVVASEPGEIVVDLGQAEGVAMDDRIRLTLAQSREMGLGHVTSVEEKLAVGEVIEVAPDRARVRLGLNEDVPVGAAAEPTDDELSRSLIAPPRPGGQWHLGLVARPYLALEDLAFGLLSTMEVGYRGEDDWHLRVLGEPLGFTLGDPSLAAVSAVGAASYDHELFEVGAGLGATRVAVYPKSAEGPTTAFTIMPLARLGALDGFHLEVHSGFVIAAEKFRYGSTTGTIQIPLARPVAMELRGGGGISGYGFGEIGLRVLALGNGGRGTVFAIPSLGAAFMFGEHGCDEVRCSYKFYGGPMVGLGFEWRP